MKNVRKIRNVNLKKIMINKKIPRCKSASWDAQKKPEKNKEAKANYNDLKVMKNKNEDVDFDFNLKNEIELAEKVYKANQLKLKENKIEDEEIN